VSTPEWVMCPEEYDELMADYAMTSLSRLEDTPGAVAKLIVLTGRVRLAGGDIHPLGGFNVLSYSYYGHLDTLETRASRAFNRCQMITKLSPKKIRNPKYYIPIRTAMRVAMDYVFHSYGQAGRVRGHRICEALYFITRDLNVRTPDEIRPLLRLIHPCRRVIPELMWVHWNDIE
jgi:hypothetical protein